MFAPNATQPQRHTFRSTGAGNDLVATVTLSLREALTGYTIELPHLDGSVLVLSADPGEVIRPGVTKVPFVFGGRMWVCVCGCRLSSSRIFPLISRRCRGCGLQFLGVGSDFCAVLVVDNPPLSPRFTLRHVACFRPCLARASLLGPAESDGGVRPRSVALCTSFLTSPTRPGRN